MSNDRPLNELIFYYSNQSKAKRIDTFNGFNTLADTVTNREDRKPLSSQKSPDRQAL